LIVRRKYPVKGLKPPWVKWRNGSKIHSMLKEAIGTHRKKNSPEASGYIGTKKTYIKKKRRKREGKKKKSEVC